MDETIPAVPTPSFKKNSFSKRRNIIFVIIGVLIIAILAYVGWWYYSQWSAYSQIKAAFDRNDLTTALSEANAFLAKNPHSSSVLTLKSLVLSETGSLQFKEREDGALAEDVANQAIKENPKNAEAWRALGYSQEIQQDYTEAHESYAKSLQLEPKNALALFDDAHTYDLQGTEDKAEAGYRASLAVNPNFDQAQAGLGRIFIAKGDTADAIDEFKKAYNGTSNTHLKAETAYTLAMLILPSDLSSAATYATAATTLDPNFPLGWYGLGMVQSSQVTATSTALSIADRLTLAQTAMASLRTAIKLNPEQSLAYAQLGVMQLYFTGDAQTASTTLAIGASVVNSDISLNVPAKQAAAARIAAAQKLVANATH